jgi:hypothetical protein
MYVLSIGTYIAISFFTKHLLSWNLALAYFLVTLEVLPRSYRRLVAGSGRARADALPAEAPVADVEGRR